MDNPLAEPVTRFIDDLTPELERISLDVGVRGTKFGDDVANEAYHLVAGFIDVDGLHTDEELWAFLATFGPRFNTMLAYATPGDVRKARLVNGQKIWLAKPSQLFTVLVTDDRRRGTSNAWRYYERAMAIAHTVASLDEHTSRDELDAIESFRMSLIHVMEVEGLSSGGRQRDGRAPQPPNIPPVLPSGEAPNAPDAVAPPEPSAPARPLPELLAELDALTGLAPVKAEVKLVANLIQVENLRKQRSMPVADQSRHLVFTGNPGTGKTTIARLLAQIYRTLGVCEKGHLVETDRSGLVAGYVGQTAIQVRQVCDSALGGLLLIDEAYALARGDDKDFGQEATDTLVKLMEDHRDDLVVVAAGYPDEMHTFIESNPGLRSRFPKTIFFPDYTTEELVAIFEGMCKKTSYGCTPEARQRLIEILDAEPRDKGFGNARHSRNLFEQAVARQASRIVTIQDPTDDQIMALLPEDFGDGTSPHAAFAGATPPPKAPPSRPTATQ